MSEADDLDGLQCFPRHLRLAGVCMRGGREWASQNGFVWSTFVSQGYPASAFLATGDFYALKVVNAARREKGLPVVGQS